LITASIIAISWGSICSATETNLQADIELALAEEGLTGIAWSIVGDSGEVSLGATGFRDNQTRTNFETDTRFHVGSLAKSLLATGILRLATEGRIELDAPVSRYLPNLTFDNQWAGIADVTVRHLLDHTSGLSDGQMWQVFTERPKLNTPLIAAFPEPKEQLHIRSRPGSRFSYSNIAYTLLGMIIESVVDRRYEAYLDEHVLTSLEMYDSTFAFTTQEGDNTDPTLAWGHVDDGSRYAAIPMFLRPAGQFTTTAADLARFAQFLLSDGTIDDHPFIDQAVMRSRGNASGTEAANAGLAAGYALGLGRRDRHGVVGYCHSGNTVGFVARLCVFPAEHEAFAYSVNTDSETADYGRLDSLFIGAMTVAEALPPRTASPAADISEWYGLYTLSPNRFPTFQYLDDLFGAIKISAAGDALTLASMQQGRRNLRPVGDRIYSANDRETSSHVFLRGIEGEYLISDGFRTFEKASTTYLAVRWIGIALGLIGMAWLFLAGIISLVRFRSKMLWRSEAPAVVAMAMLFVPIPFFMYQPFMALGELTIASALLAAVTALLPFGMLLTIMRARKTWQTSRSSLLHGVAAVFVLQWCVVLVAVGLLPLRTWTL
jgi:CubicO group peptidase (beta-lactamase class C family)